MPHFDVITRQKELLREKILQNQTIVDLLVNTGDNMAEFEPVRTGRRSPAAPLVKKHFFVPETATGDKNYISMRSRILRADNDVVKETAIVVYVICNDDQNDLLQGARSDLIAEEIDKLLNNGSEPLFGLGGVELSRAEEVRFAQGYSGWEIPYVTHEFNRGAERL